MKSWTTAGGSTIYRVLQGRSNAYLVEAGAHLLLVDTGIRLQRRSLLQKLAQFGVEERPFSVALTHSHFDHAANAACLVERYQPPVLVHHSEADFLRRGQNTPVHGTVLFTRLLSALPLFEAVFSRLKYAPVAAELLLEERFDLKEFGIDGYLLHTPGHSPGSMSVILENEIAIVGDTLSCFLFDTVMPTYALDVRLLLKSWQTLLESGCTRFLPGHGGECGRELVQQQYNVYRRKFDV